MPFLIGEVGGISKHVPTVQKEGRASSGEQHVFDVPHLISFLFTVYGDSIHCFEFLARTTFAMYVCIYVHIYVHVLACTSIYVHVVGSFW